MNNNLLDLFSVVHEVLEGETMDYENKVSEADTSEGSPLKESRELVISEINGTMQRLEQMKQDISKMSVNKLMQHYGLK